MKYFFILVILILSSCSLNRNSTYWNNDQVNKSSKEKVQKKILNKYSDFKSMTFDDFNFFLKNYADVTDYPNIDN